MSGRGIFATLAVAAILGGCASYEPSSPLPPARSDFDLTETDGVFAGAVPYATVEEQEAAFDANLDASGVIALHVFVENRGAGEVLVRPTDMALSVADGRAISPSGVSKVASKVGEDGSVIGATIAFGIIGAIAASDAEEEARAARINDYTSRSLARTELAPGASRDGVVFFIPPKSWPAFDRATLSVRPVGLQDGESWIVPVELDGLNFDPDGQEG